MSETTQNNNQPAKRTRHLLPGERHALKRQICEALQEVKEELNAADQREIYTAGKSRRLYEAGPRGLYTAGPQRPTPATGIKRRLTPGEYHILKRQIFTAINAALNEPN